ncbi:hypothetical protein ABXV22_08595 [Vibrio rotiferianus]|uniref:Lipoprotein n=1 Tax=Vibrio rotiferianus TaxID=190895 RepID=A0A7Y3ZE87_9VIBR|nr:hypothetical protein [Vibrio rotiferianus]NOH50480.1 hypothetical protein [Vibrio rotiferianus]
MRILITTIMGLALTACGGGGGGGGTTPPPPPAQTVLPEETFTMQDLDVPDGFSYNPVVQHAFSVDISGFSSQRAHLSVYKDFLENSPGNYDAIYPSKVVSAPLTNGKVTVDFNVSDSQDSLLVEIWFYDGRDPLQRVITSADSAWLM